MTVIHDRDTPHIGVVIPVFNRPTMIGEAVASVLAQTGVTVEVVVVDDGSTDATPEVVDELAARHPEVRAIHQENAGPSTARNAGVELCDTELIAFLDSDDLMVPHQLRTLYDAVRAEDADAAFARCTNVLAPGVEPPPMMPVQGWYDAEHPWHPVAILETMQAFHATGGFDPALKSDEDMDHYARLLDTGHHVVKVDQPLTVRRITGDNLIYGVDPTRVLLNLLRRRRGARPQGATSVTPTSPTSYDVDPN